MENWKKEGLPHGKLEIENGKMKQGKWKMENWKLEMEKLEKGGITPGINNFPFTFYNFTCFVALKDNSLHPVDEVVITELELQ